MAVPPRSRGQAEQRARRSFVARRVVLPVQSFIHTAGLSGYALVAAAVAALVWANSPWGQSYFDFQHSTIRLHWALPWAPGLLSVEESLQHWVNDLLMTLFFFTIGLEIKRELVEGELSDPRRAALPAVAALGGMVVPALIYAAVNLGTPEVRGWGIPMATDIAFALGVLALLGDRIPGPVRILLLALAIVDDIGAILVIAVFYAQGISWPDLGAAAVLLAVIVAMRYSGVLGFGPYVLVGGLVWVAVFRSGVHATLSGVVLGLMTPTSPYYSLDHYDRSLRALRDQFEQAMKQGDRARADAMLGQYEELTLGTESPLDRLERILHPWSSFVVLPIFALLNAGVRLDAQSLSDALTSRVTLGIVLGLVVGKIVGILGFSFAATRAGIARLPAGSSWKHVAGVAMLGGIGFTVSLFIADLAFTDTGTASTSAAKIGILAASVLAGILGFAYLRFLVEPPADSA